MVSKLSAIHKNVFPFPVEILPLGDDGGVVTANSAAMKRRRKRRTVTAALILFLHREENARLNYTYTSKKVAQIGHLLGDPV